MEIEVERKFLVDKDLFWEHVETECVRVRSEFIEQGYLSTGKGPTVRIRIRNDQHAELCIKKKINDLSCEEYEYTIPIEEGREMIKGLPTVKKERLFLAEGFTLDRFRGDLEGLYLAEYEAESEDAVNRFDPPKYCLDDVTDDSKYRNAALAYLGYDNGRLENRRFLQAVKEYAAIQEVEKKGV